MDQEAAGRSTYKEGDKVSGLDELSPVPDRGPGRPWLFLVVQYLSITANHSGGRRNAVEIILNSIFARESNRLRRVRLVAAGSESRGYQA